MYEFTGFSKTEKERGHQAKTGRLSCMASRYGSGSRWPWTSVRY